MHTIEILSVLINAVLVGINLWFALPRRKAAAKKLRVGGIGMIEIDGQHVAHPTLTARQKLREQQTASNVEAA